jgi:hypothetical protein
LGRAEMNRLLLGKYFVRPLDLSGCGFAELVWFALGASFE